MDWMGFVSNMTSSLAWPVVTVILVLILRPNIITLLALIKRIKAGPIEAEFDREIRELRSEAEIDLPPNPVAIDIPPAKKKLLQLAEINPRSAIIEAWQELEFLSRKLTATISASTRSRLSPMAVSRYLSKAQLLTPEELALFNDLRALRNSAAHSEIDPSSEAALNFIELAEHLRVKLDALVTNQN